MNIDIYPQTDNLLDPQLIFSHRIRVKVKLYLQLKLTVLKLNVLNCFFLHNLGLLLSVKLQLHTVDLHPTILADGSIIRHRTKRWAFYEIHKCGRIKGYSCLEHRHCYERYLRRDMVCFEVYPCLSSCIFIAQLHDAEKLNEQIKKLLLDGIPVNNHNDPINYVREQTAKLLKELNLTLPLHNQPKVSVLSSPSPPPSSSSSSAAAA
ncbi:unnamed protein product [Schistosoma margrebowiei]|uniref:Uncharacterized protein n=1 Tax=Schistosoma margrebowiei TaxID=48269 RepID=A0A183N6V7_9TREM|nr:unnamed protein product [Schistosoma margrebowiei]